MFSISHRIKALMVAQRLTASDSTKRHPRIIMEVTSGNALDNVFVSEVFSDRIVDNFQELIEKKEVPIDRALGEYSPSRRPTSQALIFMLSR